MKALKNYFPRFIQITDTITKEMSAEEFIEFVGTHLHLIQESTFVPRNRRSGSFGKFRVVINDGNLHITTPKF